MTLPKILKIVSLSISIFLFAILFFWVAILRTEYLKDVSGYTFQVDVLSVDNFYDEDAQDYSGEELSLTDYSYELVGAIGNIYSIKNIFDVRTVGGEKIFAVERNYGVDSNAGEHVPGYGDKDREGYLFAPKSLTKGEEFIYWHINYDEPAVMKFVNKEVINGLEVFLYESDYHADQTLDLTHLPGVPEERGVNLDINLKLWIEPNTGTMIKYEDSTTAYYYDINTGERIHPWNKFSNRLTDASVSNRVVVAQTLISKQIIANTVIPIGTLGIGIISLLLFFALNRRVSGNFIINPSRKVIAIALTFLLIIVVALIVWARSANSSETESEIKIGIAMWVDNEDQVKNVEEFKRVVLQAGLGEVEFIEGLAMADHEKMREIILDFKNNKVDLIYTLTTPGTLIAKEMEQEIQIVFSVVTYPVESGVVNSLTHSGNNLTGTRNWVSVEDQFSNFKSIFPFIDNVAFVHRAGEPNSDIQLLELEKLAELESFEVIDIAATDVDDIVSNLDSSESEISSILLACDTLVQNGGEEVALSFAAENSIPVFSCNHSGVSKGALIGTTINLAEIGEQSAHKAIQILRGATPDSIEINTGIKPEIYINSDSANRLKVDIPQSLFVKATEIYK